MADVVETHIAEVLADTERPVARRARFTREHLTENGLNVQDIGLEVANPNDDAALVRAVIKLQMKVFPGDKKEWDGMFGKETFEAYQKSLEKENQAKLTALKGKVEAARKARYEAEGAMVQHDRISSEITSTYGITAEVIQKAEQECAEEGNVETLPNRENFVKLVDYVSRVTDVPPNAIVALVSAETDGDFNTTNYGPVEELGMGQFVQKYWGGYTKNPLFKQEMAKFTTQAPESIGRARSIVADLLAVGIKLKQSERVVGEFHYVTHLTPDQLFAMRFHYHAPGYASVYYGKADRGPDYARSAKAAHDRYGARYKSRFADRAEQIYASLNTAIERLHS